METSTDPGARGLIPGGASDTLRYAVVALAVALYVALGFALRPGTNWYLLLGIPITVLFQLLIARRPLRELWLRAVRPRGSTAGRAPASRCS